MTTPTPAPTPDRDLTSPVDRALASALRDAGGSWGVVPDEVATEHLAAITALAAEHAHVAARPPTPTWRSRMRRVAGLTIVKVAVGAGVAAAATTGGLAAGGHLPDPVQGAVADGVRWIGIDLPRPSPTPAPEDADDADPGDTEDAGGGAGAGGTEVPDPAPPRDVPTGDTPDGPEVTELVPEHAPPVTPPSTPGPPDDRPGAPPANGKPDADDPDPGGDPGPDREPAPRDRGPDGPTDQGPGDDHSRAPARAPSGPREPHDGPPGPGQAQSGQVPTSSRR